MTDVDTVALEMANRLYLANLEIAERTLARAHEDLFKVQRRVNEAYDRVKELKDHGFAHALATIENRCTCGEFVPDSSGDAGCGNCGADYPP